MIVPLIFFLRKSMTETQEFEEAQEVRASPEPEREILEAVAKNWRIVVIGMLLVTMTTVSFYFITAYTPTFGREVLKLTGTDALMVTLCVGISNLFWLPVMGALSDRIGRKPVLLTFTLLMLVTAYPALSWLVGAPSFTRLLMVELWLSFIYASYNGAMVVALTEVIPVHVRTVGFSGRLQPRDRAVWRLHARDLDLSDRDHRQPRGRRIVADVRGRLRARRDDARLAHQYGRAYPAARGSAGACGVSHRVSRRMAAPQMP